MSVVSLAMMTGKSASITTSSTFLLIYGKNCKSTNILTSIQHFWTDMVSVRRCLNDINRKFRYNLIACRQHCFRIFGSGGSVARVFTFLSRKFVRCNKI